MEAKSVMCMHSVLIDFFLRDHRKRTGQSDFIWFT